jgi:hypothetical protein
MRQRGLVLSLAALAAGLLSAPSRLDAQRSPRVQVQLAPFCNVLTLDVTEDDRGLAVAGSDDRCGVGTPASISGGGLRNADGTLGMALYARDGREVQLVSLQLDATGNAGTWHGTSGRSGVATPGLGRRFDIGPADAPSGPGSSFFPRNICTYGRQLIRIQDSEIICDDVNTPVPADGSDMALGSDGNPIFVGGDAAGAGVVVTHCGNPACSAGNTSVPLSTTASAARITVGLDGLPLVAMVSDGTLTVTRCLDLACTSAIESPVGSASGLHFGIVIGSDGLPLVVSAESGLRRVIHCGDAACAAGNTTVDVPLQHATGVGAEVAVAPNGLPVIAFRYEAPFPQVEDGVKLHFCAELTCSTGATSAPVLLNTASQNNRFCCGVSLAIGSDGLPIVASHRMFWGLWAAHCDDSACSSSTNSTKNDDQWVPGGNVDLIIGAHGVPVMSHFGVIDLTLRVTECRDVACTGFSHPTRTLDSGATHRTNVLGSEGLPIIVYSAGGGPRVVGCGTRGCQLPAPSLTPVPGPMSTPPQGR